MIKRYQIYLLKLFYKKILLIGSIFFCLVLILNILEEINFFKDLNVSFFFTIFISLLKSASDLFEIFPFIVMISTQFLFLDLIENNELETFKTNGINNLKLIKVLFFSSFFLGLILTGIFYNIAAKMNFFYLEKKNSYSLDNDYLLVVNNNGLWIKDKIYDETYIISANTLEKNYLNQVVISKFDKNFDLELIIKSPKVDISSFEWEIYDPRISKNNITLKSEENIFLKTHFDEKKIYNLYENLLSLTIFELISLKKDYDMLGYSSNEIENKIQRLISYPVYLTILVLLISIIMFNIKRNKTFIFHIVLGVAISVIIYYFYDLFSLLGENNTIPILVSVWLPLLILTFVVIIGLITVNEK